MNTQIRNLVITLALWLAAPLLYAQGTTAFTYQGQLRDTGSNANGTYTMIFKLYDAVTNGDLIAGPITNSPTLSNGLFSVNLDFGSNAFNGNARWLDITITNGGTTQELSPRVQVLPSPYALYANYAATAFSLDSGTWYASVFNSNGYTNVFSFSVNGSFILGLTTNEVYVPNKLEVQNELQVDNELDVSSNLNVSGGVAASNLTIGGSASFGSVNVNSNLTVGSNINLTGGQSISVNSLGGIDVDSNAIITATGNENLRLVRGSVNGDGSIAWGTNFAVTYIPPGTGGTIQGISFACTNGIGTITANGDVSTNFQEGLWLEIGNGLYQVGSILVVSSMGPTTTVIGINPSFYGLTGNYDPVKGMTLWPSYTVTFSAPFTAPPVVILGGGRFYPTAFSNNSWQIGLDASQVVTGNSFGVANVLNSGILPAISTPPSGFAFIAVGDR